MKKKLYLLIVLGFIIFIGVSAYKLFFSLDNLPKGELINQVKSPNGTYTIKGYIISGNATVDFAIRGELIFNKEKRRPKTIYWNYHEEKANIKWINEHTVQINKVTLDVLKDIHDFRRE